MPEPIEIKLDNKELQQTLDKFYEKTSDLRPLMKNIAGIMADSVEENFKQEGQPDKWADLAESTIKLRKKKGYWPGKILQLRGELAASITSEYSKNSAIVGTNKAYAAIHQFGGKAVIGKKVEIPDRTYLKLTNSDLNKTLEKALSHLEGN
jgi:phage virion morphogenesis protein